MTGQWNWFTGGIALGVVFLLAVFLVKPIGVSTQFVIFDGIVWNALSDNLITKRPSAKSGYASTNAYLNKSGGKYSKNVMNPINYSFIFVLSMVLGAFLSAKTGGPQPTASDRIAPAVWRSRFGEGGTKRYVVSFTGGVVLLFGARLAGGVHERAYDERHHADLNQRLSLCNRGLPCRDTARYPDIRAEIGEV